MTLAEFQESLLKRWGIEANDAFTWDVLEKKAVKAFVQGEGNTGEPNDMALIALYLDKQLIASENIDVPALEDGADFFDVQSLKLANEKARADEAEASKEAKDTEIAELKAELIAVYEDEASDDE